nr:ATP synthase F0 subunit 8 [Tropidothorax sinensis]
MPQMSPMWWEMLFISFNMLFMMINIFIFWNTKANPISNKIKISKTQNIWKW